AGLPLTLPLSVAGYSMGAGIVSWQATREVQLRPGRLLSCLTIGEPKTGDNRQGLFLTDKIKSRWQRPGDIVPYLPPDIGPFRWLAGLVPGVVATAWARYRHNGEGLEI